MHVLREYLRLRSKDVVACAARDLWSALGCVSCGLCILWSVSILACVSCGLCGLWFVRPVVCVAFGLCGLWSVWSVLVCVAFGLCRPCGLWSAWFTRSLLLLRR
jgi:hypothetical protein